MTGISSGGRSAAVRVSGRGKKIRALLEQFLSIFNDLCIFPCGVRSKCRPSGGSASGGRALPIFMSGIKDSGHFYREAL